MLFISAQIVGGLIGMTVAKNLTESSKDKNE